MTEPVPERFGNGPMEEADAGGRCGKRRPRRNRLAETVPIPGTPLLGPLAAPSVEGLPAAQSPLIGPAERRRMGSAGIPVRRLRQGRPLSGKHLRWFAVAGCSGRGAKPPLSALTGGRRRRQGPGPPGPAAVTGVPEEPPGLRSDSVVVRHRGSRERSPPPAGSPAGWTRTESGHSSRLRWVDPEPRKGPGSL
jgi:hypothetical protein